MSVDPLSAPFIAGRSIAAAQLATCKRLGAVTVPDIDQNAQAGLLNAGEAARRPLRHLSACAANVPASARQPAANARRSGARRSRVRRARAPILSHSDTRGSVATGGCSRVRRQNAAPAGCPSTGRIPRRTGTRRGIENAFSAPTRRFFGYRRRIFCVSFRSRAGSGSCLLRGSGRGLGAALALRALARRACASWSRGNIRSAASSR